MLSHVADFNFNWHNTYVYAETAAPLLPKGTIIKITAWHDNTAANKANPDPNVWVGYGDRTVDEMAHAWVNVTYMNDADYRAAIEERRKALSHDDHRVSSSSNRTNARTSSCDRRPWQPPWSTALSRRQLPTASRCKPPPQGVLARAARQRRRGRLSRRSKAGGR